MWRLKLPKLKFTLRRREKHPRGPESDQKPSPAPAAALLPELLVLIMEILGRRSGWRTLANFAAANRQCMELALPILISVLDVTEEAGFSPEKLVAFSKDALGVDKFRLVTCLKIQAKAGWTDAVIAIMRRCHSNLQSIFALMEDEEAAKALWIGIQIDLPEALGIARSPRGRIAKMPWSFVDAKDFLPRNLGLLTIDVPEESPGWHKLLLLLEDLPRLETLLTNSSASLAALHNYPRTASGLKGVTIFAPHLDTLVGVPGLRIESLCILLINGPGQRWWMHLLRMPTVRKLHLQEPFTSAFADAEKLPASLREIYMSEPVFNFEKEEDYESARLVLERSSVEKIVFIDWAKSVEDLSTAREVDFWKGMTKVRFGGPIGEEIRKGDWACHLDFDS
jgi:hypothetical protein